MKSESVGEFGVWQREKVYVNSVSCKRFVLNFVNSFVYDFNVNLKNPLQIDCILWFALRNVSGGHQMCYAINAWCNCDRCRWK